MIALNAKRKIAIEQLNDGMIRIEFYVFAGKYFKPEYNLVVHRNQFYTTSRMWEIMHKFMLDGDID